MSYNPSTHANYPMNDGKMDQRVTALEQAKAANDTTNASQQTAIEALQRRIPVAPATAGTYVLQATVTVSGSSVSRSYAWVAVETPSAEVESEPGES